MDVHHKTFSLQEFTSALPDLLALDYSMMYYIFRSQTKSPSSSASTIPALRVSRTAAPGRYAIIFGHNGAETWARH
jgi:hypothetical protein